MYDQEYMTRWMDGVPDVGSDLPGWYRSFEIERCAEGGTFQGIELDGEVFFSLVVEVCWRDEMTHNLSGNPRKSQGDLIQRAALDYFALVKRGFLEEVKAK